MRLPFFQGKQPSESSGTQAEKLAEQFLLKEGLTLKVRNFLGPRGEIDLIMFDNDTLVFIEVRLRKNPRFSSACESITSSKQKKIILTAKHYLQQQKLYDKVPCRFDVIAWDSINTNTPPVWIKSAFTEI